MNPRKLVVIAFAFCLVICGLLAPKSANAQDIPTRQDGSPIVELCNLLWEEARGVYMVTCMWYLAIPILYTRVSDVLPEPPPPTPTPTPEPPSFANYDSDSDGLAITQECVDNRCDEYAYVVFIFEEDAPGTPRCENPYKSTLHFDNEAGESMVVRNPYFIALAPLDNEFGFTAKIKRFTISDKWTYSWYYDLAIWCPLN